MMLAMMPLGVAGGAAPDVLAIFARGKEGGRTMHVAGKRDSERLAPLREDVEAARLDFEGIEAAHRPERRRQRGRAWLKVIANTVPRCG